MQTINRSQRSHLLADRCNNKSRCLPFHGSRQGLRQMKQHGTQCQPSSTGGLFIFAKVFNRLTVHRAATSLKAAASDVATAAGTVRFSIQQATAFGECVKVVGGSDFFGDWKPANAPGMVWNEGNVWSLALALPPGDYKFKFVIYREDGTATWEDGDNRVIVVPSTLAPGQLLEAKGGWGETTATVADVVVVEPPSNGNGIYEAQAEEPPVELSNGNGVYDSEPERTGTMKVGRGQAKNGTVVAEATVEEEQEEEEVLRAEGSGMVTAGEAAVAAMTIAEPPSTEQETRPPVEESTGGEAGNPSSSGDMAVAVFSLLAAPLVAYSIFTLKTTGCGLPPGPSGLLGAAEGVSYLAIAAGVFCGVGRRVRSAPSTPVFLASELTSYAMVAAGLVVLALQVKDYGYIPSALPDAKCFGDTPTSTFVASFSPVSLTMPDISITMPQINLTLPELPTSIDMPELPESFTSTLSQVPGAFSANLSQISNSLSQLPDSFPDVSDEIATLAVRLPELSVQLPPALQDILKELLK